MSRCKKPGFPEWEFWVEFGKELRTGSAGHWPGKFLKFYVYLI